MRQRKSNVNLPAILFHEGLNYRSYEYFGVHRMVGKYVFRVWVPKALSVTLVLCYKSGNVDFSMNRITDGGIWEIFIHTLDFLDAKFICEDPEGVPYFFRITTEEGVFSKNDPFAFNLNADGKGMVVTKFTVVFEDEFWDIQRFLFADEPKLSTSMNICRIDVRSIIKNHPDIPFRNLVKKIVSAVRKKAYTHVLVEPFFNLKSFSEDRAFPRVIYSVCTDVCSQDDLCYFVNKFHHNNIGVILDFDPVCFFGGESDIDNYDGNPLWEIRDERQGNVTYYDVAKNEVVSYLISSAAYYLERFRFDGLNLYNIGRLLDINCGKDLKDWKFNRYGSTENLVGRFFLKQFCEAVTKEYPLALLMIDGVEFSPRSEKDRLNFDFEFDFKIDGDWFSSFSDFWREEDEACFLKSSKCNFVLPFIADKVINSKESLIEPLFNDHSLFYGALRAVKILQMTLPFKKMDFAGDEFGQVKIFEENEMSSQEARFKYFTESLNLLYHKEHAYFEEDPDGREISFIDTKNERLVAFKRNSRKGKECLIAINFSKAGNQSVTLPALAGVKYYKTLFNSNEKKYGGDGGTVLGRYRVRNKSSDFDLLLPPLSGVILEPIEETTKR